MILLIVAKKKHCERMKLASIAEAQPIFCKDSANRTQ